MKTGRSRQVEFEGVEKELRRLAADFPCWFVNQAAATDQNWITGRLPLSYQDELGMVSNHGLIMRNQ